jgi:hypothetical protein
MLISREKQFVFVHIQKTAGSSLRVALEQSIPDLKPMLGTHDSAIAAKDYLGAAEYDRYFTAAFVRDPWARLVSWYNMIVQQSSRLSMWEKLRKRGKYLHLWQYVHENSNSFEEFVLNCTDEIEDRDGKKSFWRNQADYISDRSGRIIVDFVGRYETLSEDAARLFDQLELPDARLPHVNSSKHQHYSAYYTDELAEIVRTRYARDVEVFGYEFQREELPMYR